MSFPRILICFYILVILSRGDNEYKLIKIDLEDGRCLDGSIPAIY